MKKRLLIGLLTGGLIAAMMPGVASAGGPATRAINGKFDAPSLVIGQSHQFELSCGGGAWAGADTVATGSIAHLAQTTVTTSAAWEWIGTVGKYTPTGPATAFSATVAGAHAFSGQLFPNPGCNAWATTGAVLMTAKNGTVTGLVTGGEIYELTYDVAGDGQESFLEVMITGGTGKYAGATGSFVTHSVLRTSGAAITVVSSRIMRGGKITY
jgi:hypothetical protein